MISFISALDAKALSEEYKNKKVEDTFNLLFPEKYKLIRAPKYLSKRVRDQINSILFMMKNLIFEGQMCYTSTFSLFQKEDYDSNKPFPIILYPETINYFVSLGYTISNVSLESVEKHSFGGVSVEFTQFISWS